MLDTIGQKAREFLHRTSIEPSSVNSRRNDYMFRLGTKYNRIFNIVFNFFHIIRFVEKKD